ncbi:MAG: protein translocase subunit SecD [Pseudomonadota bacterium]|nr:protein translocase subunit SecD [Pseudomonadota bacterium]MED5340701.1 protein translocase subunit SecD [Pseudomonadota bacterium]
MAELPPDGTPLLGVPRRSSAPLNSFASWQYVLIFTVLLIGTLYAAPNVFQPDPAIQVRSLDQRVDFDPQSNAANQALLARLQTLLNESGIAIKGADIEADSLVIRVDSDEAQLRAQQVANAALNANGLNYVVALASASTTPEWLQNIGGEPMNLGLDLFGGSHFLLQVNMDEYLDRVIKNTAQSMRDTLIDERIRFSPGRDWVVDDAIEIAFRDATSRDEAEDALSDFQDFQVFRSDVDNKPGLRFVATDEKVRALEDRAISQNLTSLRNRVNELGVSEPQVQRLGRARIVVDLPGIQDSARAKEILNKFANLEFRLEALPNARRSQIETYPYNGRNQDIMRRNIVTGNNVQDAKQSYDPETGQPQVNIELDNDGGRRMNAITKDNVGRAMAILFIEQKPRVRKTEVDGETVEEFFTEEDRRLISVATIQSALGFSFRITGLSLREAQDLALLLRAGALAAPMYIVEERTVGAQLGDENIQRGWQSVSIGFVLVLIFMLVYYRWFGLAANVALTTNLVLLVAIMSVLGATLTLPGIAGIVLTVGMAVDANVLIFSRIREELKIHPPQRAIQAGFDRALLTITDANVTTFFVAIILLSIGSGPVRGFAVTLAVGIVTSMFTAILVTRALVNLMFGGRKVESLKI